MRLLIILAVISVLSLASSLPVDMAKGKKNGNEKAMTLNTDRTGRLEKRAKEMLMFGNQQNSPRIKKADPESEIVPSVLKTVSLNDNSNSEDKSKGHKLTIHSLEHSLSESEESDSAASSEESKQKSTASAADSNRTEDDDDDDDKEEEEEEESNDSSHQDDDDDDNHLDTDDDEDEQVNNDSDDDQDDDQDNDKFQAMKKNMDIPLFPEDSIDRDQSISKLNKIPLSEEAPPRLETLDERVAEKELPELVEAGLESKPNVYDDLVQEYEDANEMDAQKEQNLQVNPLLNYIYRRRRELEERSPRTKRELFLPEDAEQYLQGEIPEKFVTLESWPNAYSPSELLEKEAPYQIDNSVLENGYRYNKRPEGGYGQQQEEEENDEDENEVAKNRLLQEAPVLEEEDDEELDTPYEEVVLDGQPGYFIPAKRNFFPYSEEPSSHYGGLVPLNDKRNDLEDDVDYTRLLQLARALAGQRNRNSVAKDEDSFSEN